MPATMTLRSAAFGDGAAVPAEFTCDGPGVSPPLSWTVPHSAVATALVVDDPDAPDGTFTHWVVVDVPPQVHAVAAGEVPRGGVQAQSSTGRAAYQPLCPPEGEHRYRFTVYALSARTGLAAGAPLARALRSVRRLAVARGSLAGSYRR